MDKQSKKYKWACAVLYLIVGIPTILGIMELTINILPPSMPSIGFWIIFILLFLVVSTINAYFDQQSHEDEAIVMLSKVPYLVGMGILIGYLSNGGIGQ